MAITRSERSSLSRRTPTPRTSASFRPVGNLWASRSWLETTGLSISPPKSTVGPSSSTPTPMERWMPTTSLCSGRTRPTSWSWQRRT
ncbi:hypothetical protein Naga_102699g1 [Nannochloropsis gaditana]|uniref:Uncharacterized protein n=1 Tax=Nannochloropsis gaditana TaxID=72520 RepID=W7U7K8_9STRA|nr:hypothetical protein Naga_102699g1 [Nannochloropsis gaditana]